MKKILLITFALFFSLGSFAQTDMTSWIVDNDFDVQGRSVWKTNGMGRQTNTSFPLKHGEAYREAWSGGTVGDYYLYQDIVNLPVGTYTLTVACQNILQSNESKICTGAWIYANDQKTDFNKPGDYTVKCVVLDGNLRVGAETKNCTGNYVCVDYFRLTHEIIYDDIKDYVNEIMDKVDEIDNHVNTAERTEMIEARDVLRGAISEGKTELYDAAVKRLIEAIQAYEYAQASATNPLDMTKYVINPDFEDGNSGWKFVDMGTQTNNGFPSKHGNTYVERWTGSNKADKGSVEQTIANLPNGRYRVSAAARNVWEGNEGVKQTGAYLYGENSQVEVGLENMYSVEFIALCNEATIGFKGDGATGNWICVDNFSLEYLGSDASAEKAGFESLISKAESLLGKAMNTSAKTALENAIKAAKAITGTEGRGDAVKALKSAIAEAESSIALYVELKGYIDYAQEIHDETGQTGKEALQEIINTAIVNYNSGNIDRETVDNAQSALENAIFCYRVENGKGTAPKVTTGEVIVGSNAMVGRMKATGSGIMETGFCWAENPNPTVMDYHSSYNQSNDETNYSPVYVMYNVQPSTELWVRAYAITKTYAVGYGEPVRVITLPKGETEYTFLWNGDDDHNEWLDNAMREATAYYNTWTAIKGFHPTANYSPGTETADCSYGGWINVGPWRCNTGTMVHEMMHGTGVGQHWRYWDSNLKDGIWWQGERANRVTHFFENYDSSRGNYNCNGDGMHICYEGNGSDMQQIRSAILAQALYEDGLPAVSDGACPFYSYESIDTLKYYFTNGEYGSAEKFLYETTTGSLAYASVGGLNDMLGNDAYAWNLLYDKMNGLYRIRNAKSGKYFSFNSSVALKGTEKPTNTEYIQLMPARITMDVTAGGKTMTMKPYWFARGNRVCEPEVMAITSKTAKSVSAPQLNFSNGATTQFWMIFTEKEISELSMAQNALNNERLERLLEGSKEVLSTAHTEATEGADDTFRKTYETIDQEKDGYTSVEQVESAVTALYQNLTDYLPQTKLEGSVDLTFMLDDPDLNTGEGWTGLPEIKDGLLSVNAGTFEFSQTIPNKMPKGTYALIVKGFERPGELSPCVKEFLAGTNKVSTYITYRAKKRSLMHIAEGGQAEKLGEGGTELKVQNLCVPYNEKAAKNYISHGFYDNIIAFTLTLNSSLSVGMKKESVIDKDWVLVDGFQLLYFGTDTTADDVANDIDGIEADDAHVYYNINGVRVSKPTTGVTIKQGKDGKAIKILK